MAICYAPIADAQARVAVVRPLSDSPRARPIGRLIRARVADATEVPVIGSPLGWRDLQLAAGCLGDGDPCFRAVAEQLEVTEIVLPVVERTDQGWVVEIIRWSADEVAPRRTVLRRRGPDAMAQVMDAASDAVRALYDLPPLGEAEITTSPTAARGIDVPIGPLLVGVGALGVAGVGLAFGLDSRASSDAWQNAPVDTAAQVDLALAMRDSAATEAMVADTLFAVAAAAAVAAVTWLILELVMDAPPASESESSNGTGASFAFTGTGFAFDVSRNYL